MKSITPHIALILLIFFSSCIKEDIIDDLIEPEIRITNSLSSLALGSTYQFEALFFDNVGKEAVTDLSWSSSNTAVATIDASGLVNAIAPGTTTIMARAIVDTKEVITITDLEIADETVVINQPRTGNIVTTSSYELKGSFTLENDLENNKIILKIAADYVASTALPGLYIYLTNNTSTVNGAFEIGPVSVFNGVHTYEIDGDLVDINQYSHILYWCKPFSVKVGEGEIN